MMSYDVRKPYERRDRYDRRPEMADERPASSYRDSEYRPVAVAPVMEQPVAEGAVQENLLAGRNPIREALKAGRDIEKLLVQKGELTGSAREIVQMAKEAHIPVQEVEHQRLNELAKNHQGMVALLIDDFPLGVHHVVVFEQAFADTEVVLFDFSLGTCDGFGNHREFDHFSFFKTQPVHYFGDSF